MNAIKQLNSFIMDNSLLENESNLYTAKIHWISYIVPVILMILGSIGIIFGVLLLTSEPGVVHFLCIFLSILFFKGLYKFLYLKSTKIFIYSGYISLTQGILDNRTYDLSLNKIEGVSIEQSLLGKSLKFGTLFVSTGIITHCYKVANPQELRQKIIKNKTTK